MNAFNSLQKMAKKNRKTFLTISCFVLLTAMELSVTFINKEAKIIKDTNDVSRINRVKIVKLESETTAQNLQLQNIVTRFSFNAYIEHTDDRFKVFNSSNESLLQSMGTLTGRVSGLEKIVYALNMYELNNARKLERVYKNAPQ